MAPQPLVQAKIIATVTVFTPRQVLWVKYRNSPDHQRGWLPPHDQVADKQHPTGVAAAVLRDQLGWADLSPRLDHVESFVGQDKTWHLPLHHRLVLPEPKPIQPGPTVAEHKWFDLSTLPDKRDVAHGGWAIEILKTIRANLVR
jgi:hypothetical protein